MTLTVNRKLDSMLERVIRRNNLKVTEKQLIPVNEAMDRGLALCFQKSLATHQCHSCKALG